MYSKELEDKITDMLAYVYAAVPWGKMKTSKNAYDIFNHRVRAACRKATLQEMISKLANYFGLQQINIEVIEIVDSLRENETEVLNIIYKEHIPICMKAIMKAKEIKKQKKKTLED